VAALLTAATLAVPLAALYELRYGGYSGDFSPKRVQELLKSTNAVLVDIRPELEREAGGVPDLRRSARDKVLTVELQPLEDYLRGQVADPREVELNRYAFTIANQEQVRKASRVIVMDKNGADSVRLARLLRGLGVGRPYTMAGGYRAWVRSGLRTKPEYTSEPVDVFKEEVQALAQEDDNLLGQLNALISTPEGRLLLAGRVGLGSGLAVLIAANLQLVIAGTAAVGLAKLGVDRVKAAVTKQADPQTPLSPLDRFLEQADDAIQRATDLQDGVIRAVSSLTNLTKGEPGKPLLRLPFLTGEAPKAEAPWARLFPKRTPSPAKKLAVGSKRAAVAKKAVAAKKAPPRKDR